MPVLKVGIIGCGFATQTRHLPALRRVPHAEVVAVADLDTNTLDSVADEWRVRHRYRSAEALIEDPEVEAVAVCVPAVAHVEVAIAALDAQKHVLVEKPLALSIADAQRLIARARLSSSKIMVGFNMRWHRLVTQARTVLQHGAIGHVHSVRTLYTDEARDRPGLPAWRTRRDLGGGALLEKAVHHFDLCRFLLEDEVDEVFAFCRRGRGEDETVSVTARMHGGSLITLIVSDATSVSNELTLYGDSGSLHVNCYRSDGLGLTSLFDLPGAPRTRLRRMIASTKQLAMNLAEIRRGGVFDATYEAEWRHFITAIQDDGTPACSLSDGLRALEIVLAAAESASIGKPVKVAQASPVESPGKPRAVSAGATL
jgi:myo-inositol 2-dehydrogenase / D-chiro-inositol 1-dehydrogenase